MLEGSIPMFSWSENSFRKIFWSYFKSFSSYGLLGLQLRCSRYMDNIEIGIKQRQKHIHKCLKGQYSIVVFIWSIEKSIESYF